MNWLNKLAANLGAASEPQVDMGAYIGSELLRAGIYIAVFFGIVFAITWFMLFGGRKFNNASDKNKRK